MRCSATLGRTFYEDLNIVTAEDHVLDHRRFGPLVYGVVRQRLGIDGTGYGAIDLQLPLALLAVFLLLALFLRGDVRTFGVRLVAGFDVGTPLFALETGDLVLELPDLFAKLGVVAAELLDNVEMTNKASTHVGIVDGIEVEVQGLEKLFHVVGHSNGRSQSDPRRNP